MSDWSPSDYLKFGDERTRAARDLLAQVPLASPKLIYDLGCGPGNSTELLLARFPQAEIFGIDHSPSMLDAARKHLPQLRFEAGDLFTWLPDRPADLLFSNATFQWVPDHPAVMRRLMGCLSPGGVLAVQMPDNIEEPTHRLMREVAEEGPWAAKLAAPIAERPPLPPPRFYIDLLRPASRHVDVWHIIYNHVLAGPEAIVEWVKPTGLRPYLDLLDESEKARFLSIYAERVKAFYPTLADGTVLLRFPRLFILAIR